MVRLLFVKYASCLSSTSARVFIGLYISIVIVELDLLWPRIYLSSQRLVDIILVLSGTEFEGRNDLRAVF